MKTKKTKLIIFTVILIIISIFIFPSIKSIYGSPSVCSAGEYGNYYAFGYINWIIQRNWIGGKATFANPNPDYYTPNSSANHTIWVTTNNSTDSWVEAGYAKGKTGDPNYRYLYWANGKYDSWGNLIDYDEKACLTPPGPPGEEHRYTILCNSADNRFILYIDNYLEYKYPSTYTKYAKEIDVGLESMAHANACREVYPTNMSYYYENQGWYSFGQAMPKIYTSDSYYHFNYTNSNKDSGVDYNDYYPPQ